MPTSGLVLTLVDDEVATNAFLSKLENDPRFALGERCGSRWPVALSATDRAEEFAALDALLLDPAVAHVDVAFVEVCEEGTDEL